MVVEGGNEQPKYCIKVLLLHISSTLASLVSLLNLISNHSLLLCPNLNPNQPQ